MCNKCDEINVTIARYRRLRDEIEDQHLNKAADQLMAELHALKVALHPVK